MNSPNEPADPNLTSDSNVENRGSDADWDQGLAAAFGTRATADFPKDNAQVGVVIAGKYKLVEPIGEGGMGSVWLAEQSEPVRRRVALKLIKAGMDSKQVIARFEAERQALAVMDHPNIAKVLDGGLHDGRPYFVMELVKGVPITEYCDAKKLTPRERLELFVPVCQAIQHAHQKGIIHRDIKPSNVLIAPYDDKPAPKVIDFGLAKATGVSLIEASQATNFGGVVGTPQYMSPEQASLNNLDIDTRSDIYALGVLLYELLTGSPPFKQKELEKAGMLEMLRVIREVEPQRPSTKLSTSDALPSLSANRGTEPKKLTGILRNELDWIVMKALEKDRSRRYETANGFAADINRYLAGEPVNAHPPSAGYRMKKFLRRHRGPVIAACLIFALSTVFIIGLIGTTAAAIKNMRRAELAESNALLKEAEAKKQEEIAQTEKKRAIEFRDKALDALRATTDTDVEQLIGGKPELGANEKAYLESIAKRWQVFANQEGTDAQTRAIRAEGHQRVANLWQKLGRRVEARPENEQALVIWEKLVADFPAVPAYRHDFANSHINLGLLLNNIGQRPQAEEHSRKALAVLEKLVADFPAVPAYRESLAASHANKGKLLTEVGQLQQAEKWYRKGLAVAEKLAADFPTVPDHCYLLAGIHKNLGHVLAQFGQRLEAEEQYRKSLAILEKLAVDFPTVPDHHRLLAGSHYSLGGHFKELGQYSEAEAHYRKGLAIQEKLVIDFPAIAADRHALADSHKSLGQLLVDLGRRSEAEKHYRNSLKSLEKLAADFQVVPEYRNDLAECHITLGNLLANVGQRSEAEEQFHKGLAILEKLAFDFPAVFKHRQLLAGTCYSLGQLFSDIGQWSAAEEQYRKSLNIQEKLVADFPAVPEFRRELAASHNSLGFLLNRIGQGAKADEQFRKGIAIQEKLIADFPAVPAYRVSLGGSYCNYGVLIHSSGKPTESLPWYDRAIDLLRAVHEKDPRAVTARTFLRNSHGARADAYGSSQKFTEAVKDWDRVIELSPPASQAGYRAKRATTRLHAGQVAEAVAEVAELTRSSKWNAGQWYDFACVYSIASGKIADKSKEYAERAMELLQKAVEAGYKNVAHMKKDPDLDPLRDREDFKKLIAELEAKAAAKKKDETK